MIAAKRLRSPNYPSLSLGEAIEMTRKLHAKNRSNPIDREAAAKDLGYTGLTGRSGKVLATLGQYGLVEKAGKGGLRVSRAATILMYGDDDPSLRRSTLIEAAFLPSLFAELHERFSDGVPSENSLKNYLIRENFAPVAVGPAMNAYLETCRLLLQEGAFESLDDAHHDAPVSAQPLKNEEPTPVQQTTSTPPPPPQPQAAAFSGEYELNDLNIDIRGGEVTINARLDLDGLRDLKERIEFLEGFIKKATPKPGPAALSPPKRDDSDI